MVPTFGASKDIAEFCVIAPWMPEGELLQYLHKYPGANRAAVVRTSPQILAGERTNFFFKDVWSGRWAFLPASQRRRSRRHERGQSHRLGWPTFVDASSIRQTFSSTTRGFRGFPTSESLQLPSTPIQKMLPPHSSASVSAGPHLRFWEHQMKNLCALP